MFFNAPVKALPVYCAPFFVMLFDVLAGGGIMILHGLTSNERLFRESEIMKNNV